MNFYSVSGFSSQKLKKNMDIFVTIFSSLLSGMIGIAVSTYYYQKHEARKLRLTLLSELIGNRHNLKGDAFVTTLNQVFVIFSYSQPVMDSLKNFHEKITDINKNTDHINDALLQLIKVMCDEMNISYNDFHDSFFLKPFS
ncbi:MAG: hypothetical protein D3924_08680 [Candidatus Electrothrix sp. AR4]|nr:hypothetical protein [Candidatus Electrothrix sp. AR4]